MKVLDVYIYGASGHGKVIFDCIISKGIEVRGFIDDDLKKNTFMDCKVYRSTDILSTWNVVVAIGDPTTRQKIVNDLNVNFVTIQHNTSIISSNTNIKEGSVFFQNSVVQSGSEIGEHSIINTSAVIDHDCHLGDYVHVAPNAVLCGGVKIGHNSWVGAGSTIIQGITIGNNCMIGAGSVIIRDIPDNAVAVGNPGKIIKYRDE
ncbi:acetyltransferase [Flammeovirga pectinis]|uniref:Acetyltransferase n=1 Tax=Flammeovirga pectinis TaxID=2494373 RepID=A0A3Q9FSA6_9BACT|nr:acetyltransferase [Flammeovirga pectinis]AZQ63562.1 acetyltransferase [Flammeovirga pectinis]